MMKNRKSFRLRDIMPEYFEYGDYKGYAIKTKPAGRWRQLFPKWPYFVGEKIRLLVEFRAVSNDAEKNPLENFILHEIYPNNSQIVRRELNDVFEKEYIKRVTSEIISQQGDFVIYAGFGYGHDSSTPLFSASILHKDRLRYDIFLICVGFLCTLAGIILAWSLGFIEIIPKWAMWIH